MKANALRWDGRPGWYEVWYLIVCGRFWLRYTLHVPRDPELDREAALWLASFTGPPAARTWTFPLHAFRTAGAGWPVELGPAGLGDREARGAVDGAAWELRFEPLLPPFDHVHPLVRPLARSRVVLSNPALEVSGFVEVGGVRHDLDGAPGHQAHVWGSRHADRFGWAHATLPGRRWVEALTAKVPGLPELSLWATERERASSPLALLRTRAELSPTRWRIGPFTVEAEPEDFVGVTYRDPDGTPLYCYHTERACLSGRGVEARDAAFEYASRATLPGWTLSL